MERAPAPTFQFPPGDEFLSAALPGGVGTLSGSVVHPARLYHRGGTATDPSRSGTFTGHLRRGTLPEPDLRDVLPIPRGDRKHPSSSSRESGQERDFAALSLVARAVPGPLVRL